MREISESGGCIKVSVKTRHGRFGVKLTREDIELLARALKCCPGARSSVAHAVWHYKNPQQLAPCPDSDMHKWH